MNPIGTAVPRVDVAEKSSGASIYLADAPIPGVLAAGLILSERPYARLVAVHLPPLPDGYVVVDHHDVPGTNTVAMINESWPLFPESAVEYSGQPIALIAGPDAREVHRLVRSTTVEYEDVVPVVGIEDAEEREPPELFVSYELTGSPGTAGAGDAAKRPGAPPVDPAPPDPFLRETFDTGPQEHIYLEPQAVAARLEADRIVVHGSMQCPFYVKKALVRIFGWDEDRIRVVQTTTGGAFGGKEEYPSVLAGYVALAAWKSGRPVRLVLDRSEDIRISTKRHPSRITYATTLAAPHASGGAADVAHANAPHDARPAALARMEAEVRTDGGAFEGLSSTVLQRAIFSASGVYRVPEIRVRGRSYRTNVVPYGAFRGFGSPQAFFAIEMHMAHLARRVGEDPLEFKRRHLLRQGDRTITGGTLRDPVLMDEMVRMATDASGYAEKRRAYEAAARAQADRRDPRPPRRGIGISLFSHGCGFTGSGERDVIRARVRIRTTGCGEAEILCANVEMGQGAQTTLRKIVARTLGVSIQNVGFANPDTDRVPDSGPTVASRTSMIVGGLLERAARKLVAMGWREHDDPLEAEAEYEQLPEIAWDQERFVGDAYPAFSWGVNVVEVELDPLTFDVRPLEVWAVYDVGEAIDRRVVLGQIHGGLVQGIGYATSEKLEVRDGRFAQTTMTDYVIPGPLDVPEIHVDLVSNPYPYGPFGAKGAGEIPFTGAAPALADAVECALGREVHRIPLTPEYLEEVAR